MRSVALLAALVAFPAAAESWLVGTVGSYHVERKDYCEVNSGVGFEHGDRVRFVAGTYHNSLCDTSNYVGVAWFPLQSANWRLGTALLAITGYDKGERSERATIAPLPTLAYEGRRFGANLILIPPYDDFKGALGLQIKWRFGS